MKYKIVICQRCGKKVRAKIRSKKYCDKCNLEVRREQDREYRKKWFSSPYRHLD